jgi:F-type H+-transporting ATPase subunit b
MPGMPAPAAAHGAAGHGADAHGAEGHGGGHCPGHGPLDPPPHVNWYQGLFGVDNEKALNGSGVQKLLYRYKNDLDECDPKNQEPPVLAALINLGVVLYLLIRFGKGPVMEGLVKRKKTLMADIENANELKTDAEKRLSTYKKQLARIEERGKELRAEYASQWEAEKKRILADAEDKSSRLRKDAEFRVSQELKQAEADLLRDSVDGALAAAEELIRKRIQDSDQTRLADEYVAGVAAALAASTSAREGRSA